MFSYLIYHLITHTIYEKSKAIRPYCNVIVKASPQCIILPSGKLWLVTKPLLPSIVIFNPDNEPKVNTSLRDHPIKLGILISDDSVLIKTRSFLVIFDFAMNLIYILQLKFHY